MAPASMKRSWARRLSHARPGGIANEIWFRDGDSTKGGQPPGALRQVADEGAKRLAYRRIDLFYQPVSDEVPMEDVDGAVQRPHSGREKCAIRLSRG